MLNDIEKLAIDGLMLKRFERSQIYALIGVDKKRSIDNYIDTQNKQAKHDGRVTKPASYDKYAITSKLSKAGIRGKRAERLIEKALINLGTHPEVGEIYNEVIKQLGPLELMVTETENGNRNVAAMTEEASGKGEKDGKKESKQEQGQNTSYIFNPQAGKQS